MKKETSRNKKIVLLILIGLAVFTAARAGLYFLYADKFASYPASSIAVAFVRGIRFDASIFLTVTIPFWVLLLLPFNNGRFHSAVTWLMYPVYAAAAIFLTADILYFGYVNRHMANEIFAMGNDLGFIADIAPDHAGEIAAAAALLAAGALLWSRVVSVKIKPEKSLKRASVFFVIWAAVIFLLIRGTVSDKPLSTIDAFVSGDSALGNLTLNGLFSAAKHISHKSNAQASDYTFFENGTAEDIMRSYASAPCVYPEGLRDVKKPNVVLVLLESWSAYYVDSFSDNAFGLTPEFDALSEKGIKFIRHYSPDKRSISSIQASLTGIPPMAGLPSLGFGLETLAKGNVGKILNEAGYETLFLQSSRRRSFYMDSIAKSLGFSEYYGMEDAGIILDYPDKTASKFGWDYETYMLLLKKLHDKSDGPFFAFLFTGTTHTPFAELPDRFMKYSYGTESEDGFKNTLLYADWSLGEFINQASREPWFNNTVFIITADHNIGKYEKISFPEDYRIPLLIYSPLLNKSYVEDNITSHIDLTPTILDIAGLTPEKNHIGRSVFCKDNESFAVISEWNTAGITSKDGFMRHSFGKILDYKPAALGKERLSEMEKALLAYYQTEFSRIFELGKNR